MNFIDIKLNSFLKFLFAFLMLANLTSCYMIDRSIMLRTPKDFEFSQFDTAKGPAKEYTIAVDDILEIMMFADEGSRLLNLSSTGFGASGGSNFNGSNSSSVNSSRGGGGGGMPYLVQFDGKIKFPVIGYMSVVGLTIREAERYIEKQLTAFYNNPFVIVRVTNRKVVVFSGEGNSSSVVNLGEENKTLFEALAESGGISDRSKAHRIKLIRGDLKNPSVYLIDLSTIEGMKQADLVLQANDIIYVEPRGDYVQKVLTEIGPYLSLLNTTVWGVVFVKSMFPQDETP